MKVSVFFKIFCVVFVSFLAGCTKESAETIPEDSAGLSVESETKADEVEVINSEKDSDNALKMIVNWQGLFNNPMACSSYGCYEVMFHADNYTGNILYTDVETRQRIFLSPDLSADHNDSSDPSWIDNTLGGCFLFTMDDTLFMSRYNYDLTPGELYGMDLDGRNRQSLVIFTDYNAPEGGIASDGQNLYMVLYKQDKQWLVRVHTDSGEIEPLKEMGGDAAFLTSAYGGTLVLKEIRAEITDSEDPLVAYQSQVHTVYQYNVTDGTETQILSWQQDKVLEEYSGEYLYILDVDNECLKEVCLSTGEERMIIDSLSAESINAETIGKLYPICDRHLIFDVGNAEGNIDKMCVDLDDGRIFSIDPYTESLDAYGSQYLGIIGEFGDEFLVTSGTLEVPMDGFDPDGNPMVVDMVMSKLSVIKKEDFWNNRFDAMEPVEDVFLESMD